MLRDTSKDIDIIDLQRRQRRLDLAGAVFCVVWVPVALALLAVLQVRGMGGHPAIRIAVAVCMLLSLGAAITCFVLESQTRARCDRLIGEALNVKGMLEKYLTQADYDPADGLDKETLAAYGLPGPTVRGAHDMRGCLDGRSVRSSSVRILHQGTRGRTRTDYRGQITVARTNGTFPGKLLLVRPEPADVSWLRRRVDYGRDRLAAALFGLRKSARERHRLIVTGALAERWVVYTDQPDQARAMLSEEKALHRALMSLDDVDFILYSGGDVVFGVPYTVDTVKGAPDELETQFGQLIDQVFGAALPALSAL